MKHELLSPAGSFETLKAVIYAGADAVYLGGNRFGARAYAQNFSDEELLAALDFAHLRGKKIFLTVNTLLKNREIEDGLYDYLLPLYENGLDAVIVQDFGVMDFIRENFPGLDIHVSTQMSVTNVYGAEFLKNAGACRLVPARELSLSEISSIYNETHMEIECFIHGALCFCYSGQCLTSSLLGGRSGNRGRCAQPCRYPYQVMDKTGKRISPKDRFPLSLKDLCTVEILPQLCEAGVYSFKIEGRMKSKEYAAGVTEIYRKYVDLFENDPENYRVEKADHERLLDLGNRNGFTEGYYKTRHGRSMVTLSNSFHTGTAARENYIPQRTQTLPFKGSIRIKTGEPMALTLTAEKISLSENKPEKEELSVCVYGETPLKAQNRPLTAEEVKKQMEKCGNTPFYLTELEVELEEGCFLPVSRLNDLRRSGLEELKKALLEDLKGRKKEELQAASLKKEQAKEIFFRENSPKEDHPAEHRKAGSTEIYPFLNIEVSDPGQLKEALSFPYAKAISLDIAKDMLPEARKEGSGKKKISSKELEEYYAAELDKDLKEIRRTGKEAFFCFPPVFRANTSSYYKNTGIDKIIKAFDGVWVRGYDSLGYALYELSLPPERIFLDNDLYVFSEYALRAFEKYGLEKYTASWELNQGELSHMPNKKAEMTIYGSTPMMVTAQCLLDNAVSCDKAKPFEGEIYLKDRKDKRLPVKRNCLDCCNIIYNSDHLYLLHQSKSIEELGFGSLRISFVLENRSQAKKILNDYKAAFIDKKKVNMPEGKETFTTGHFKKGVE